MSLTKIRDDHRQPHAAGDPIPHGEPTGRRSAPRKLPLMVPVAFGVYAVLLAILTLFKSTLSLGGMWNTAAHQQRSLDLVLFNGFLDPPVWWGPWLNTLGNIALFVPFGFFLYLVLRHRESRWPLLEVVVFSGLVSLVIECLQWTFAIGYTDVDDLLLNALGGVLGGMFAWQARRVPQVVVKRLSLAATGGCLLVLAMIAVSSSR